MAFSIDNLLKPPANDFNSSFPQRDPIPLPHPCYPLTLPLQPNGHVTPNLTVVNANQNGTSTPATIFSLDLTPAPPRRNAVLMPTLADLQLLFGGGGQKAYGRGNRRHGAERKPRQAYSNKQLETLEDEFRQEKYLTTNKRSELSKSLKLTENQMKTWFQNRRYASTSREVRVCFLPISSPSSQVRATAVTCYLLDARRTKWKKQMTTSLRQLYQHGVIYPLPYAVGSPCGMPSFNGRMTTSYGDPYQTSDQSSCSYTNGDQSSVLSLSTTDTDDQRSD